MADLTRQVQSRAIRQSLLPDQDLGIDLSIHKNTMRQFPLCSMPVRSFLEGREVNLVLTPQQGKTNSTALLDFHGIGVIP
jgi:hypothetical protein